MSADRLDIGDSDFDRALRQLFCTQGGDPDGAYALLADKRDPDNAAPIMWGRANTWNLLRFAAYMLVEISKNEKNSCQVCDAAIDAAHAAAAALSQVMIENGVVPGADIRHGPRSTN
jgi:hypothetical protein